MSGRASQKSSRRFWRFALAYLLWPPFAFAVAAELRRLGTGRANPLVEYIFLAAALVLLLLAFREAQAEVWLALPSLIIAAFANAFVLALRVWAAYRLYSPSSQEVPKK